ncbi:MAG: alpha/beta hydrolase [Caldilineaceae bacterium]
MSNINIAQSSPVLVDVGGRRLAATVLGQGEPFVLLETGFGVESAAWAAVAEAVAKFTRVCFYDRAGRGVSDPAHQPRQPADLVQDAYRLLHSTAGASPCLYVGQSFGGLIARLYAQQHPADVAGIVLVDSFHEAQFETFAPLFPAVQPGEPVALTAMRTFWAGGWRDPAQNKEGIDMQACQVAGRSIATLGDIPLRVLTAQTYTHQVAPIFPAGGSLTNQALWEEMQSQFLRLSTDTTQCIIQESGYFIQVDKPQVIGETIAELVENFRRTQSADQSHQAGRR